MLKTLPRQKVGVIEKKLQILIQHSDNLTLALLCIIAKLSDNRNVNQS